MQSHQIGVRLKPDQYEKLERAAAQARRNVADFVRVAALQAAEKISENALDIPE